MEQNLPAHAEDLRDTCPLQEGMATLFSTLALENPMDREAWQATVHGTAKSWM